MFCFKTIPGANYFLAKPIRTKKNKKKLSGHSIDFIILAFSFKNGADNSSRSSKKLRIMEEVIVKSKSWQLTEIQDPAKCRISIMPERDTSGKVR